MAKISFTRDEESNFAIDDFVILQRKLKVSQGMMIAVLGISKVLQEMMTADLQGDTKDFPRDDVSTWAMKIIL